MIMSHEVGRYLYHATDKDNLESIKKHGLLINPPKHAYAHEIGVGSLEGKIFLAFDSDVAESYAETSDECPDEIVILKIDIDALDQKEFGYDWNNRCEYFSDINSCVYTKDIPADAISVVESKNDEPFNLGELEDFKGTLLYERVTRVFDEEVETNLENFF